MGVRTDISIMTWNIRDGRQGGLECAARALRSMHVNIAVVQETKILRGMHTKPSSGIHNDGGRSGREHVWWSRSHVRGERALGVRGGKDARTERHHFRIGNGHGSSFHRWVLHLTLQNHGDNARHYQSGDGGDAEWMCSSSFRRLERQPYQSSRWERRERRGGDGRARYVMSHTAFRPTPGEANSGEMVLEAETGESVSQIQTGLFSWPGRNEEESD